MRPALFGYGGHAREVAAHMGEYLRSSLTYFVDDEFVVKGTRPISEFDPEKYAMLVAIGDGEIRRQIVNQLPSNTTYLTFIHPSAQILDANINIGEGSFIGANSVLTNNITIGKHAILNRANHVGHDTTIGDFFSAMPGAIVSGDVTIGDNVYIGTNASIKEKITISNNILVGLNAGVVHNLTIEGTYVGLPAKLIN